MKAQKTNQTISEALIPIVVGVTGHRDLRPEDLPSLKNKVGEIFADLKLRYTHSPLVLLSPLAEGADRLVARIALEAGVALVVPLPMPLEEYRKDFKDTASQAEFDELLRGARWRIEMPLMEGNTPEAIASPGKARNLQYGKSGAFIAHHSQILIALWDGELSNQEAGTSFIIRFKLDGIPEPYAKVRTSLSQMESGPVHHIITPRTSNPRPKGQPLTLETHFPRYWGDDAKANEVYGQILKRVDSYNQDVRRCGSFLSGSILQSERYLFPEDKEGPLEPDCKTILKRYAFADALANLYKKHRVNTIVSLLSLVVLAFFFFQIYLEFMHTPLALILYPVTLGIGAAWFVYAKRRDFEFKHEDYRALAEAMRVLFYWRLADVEDDASEHYLRKHKGELEWIRYGIRIWGLTLDGKPQSAPKGDCQIDRLRMVLKYWVENQKEYFSHRSKEDSESLEKHERWANSLFVAGMGLALALVVLDIFKQPLEEMLGHSFEWIHHAVVVMIGMSLVISAAMHGYAEKMALSEQTKNYSRMAGLYNLATERLSILLNENKNTEARALVLNLGKEALEENGDWLLLHRARPLEIPKG